MSEVTGSLKGSCSTTASMTNLPASPKKPVNIFKTRYLQCCKNMNTKPVKGLILQIANGSLDIIVDRIKFEDWVPILKAISRDRNLHFIGLKSNHTPGTIILEHVNTEKLARQLDKGSVLFTKYMLIKVNEALADCISNSKNLTCLQFQYIPLQREPFSILTKAIMKTQSIQHISFQSCNIGDEGCNLILQALKNTPTVLSLDLSDCNITNIGASYIADLIKFQELARYGECWKHSLRYREVAHHIIPGLRRISLNNNPQIGDEGLQSIIIILCDDYWIKAIDMQNCGITDYGCSSILDLINMNHEIAVFDVRRNPIRDTDKISEIIKILYAHANVNDRAEYGWIKEVSGSSSSSSGGNSIGSTGNISGIKIASTYKGSTSTTVLYGASKRQRSNIPSSPSCCKVCSNAPREPESFFKKIASAEKTLRRKLITSSNPIVEEVDSDSTLKEQSINEEKDNFNVPKRKNGVSESYIENKKDYVSYAYSDKAEMNCNKMHQLEQNVRNCSRANTNQPCAVHYNI